MNEIFTVNCTRIKNKSKYFVKYPINDFITNKIKEFPKDERSWNSASYSWELKAFTLFKLIKSFRGSNGIFFDFGDIENKKLFIKIIEKERIKEEEKLKKIQELNDNKNIWIKYKSDLETNYLEHSEYVHSFLNKGVVLYPHQIVASLYLNKVRNALLALGMGSGKAQPIDSKILTPDGWKLMGDIKYNDLVIGSDGKPKKVLAVFPQGIKKIYNIKFNDGTLTQSCEEHLWNVNSASRNKRGLPFQTKTLREIIDSGLTYENGKNKFYIPIVEPVSFSEKELKIDPYVLGCLLGDECASIKYHNLTNCNSHIKFIPDEYKFGSITQRLELLQGILDTNGYSGKKGFIQITLASKQLIDDIQFIVESLGGIARLHDKWVLYKGERRHYYRLHIKLPPEFTPFKLKRKIETFIPPTNYLPNRAIKNVEYMGEKEAKCILIDSEDQLYVTDHCILTHNSLCSITYSEMNQFKKVFVICPNSLKYNYKNEIEKFTQSKAHIIGKKNNYTIEESKYIIVNYDYFNSANIQKTKDKFNKLNIGKIDCLIVDECFTYNTLIDTDHGKLMIGDIVENKLNVKILSYNHELKKIETKPILRHLYNGYKNTIIIKLSNGNIIECTPEHKFYSVDENKYKSVELFKIGEGLYECSEEEKNTNKIYKMFGMWNRIQAKMEQSIFLFKNLFHKIYSNRNKWKFSEDEEIKIFRQKKNRNIGVVRVESIDILESRDRSEFRKSSDRYKKVYDLEIEDNHNYFANNILVSNCHRISSTTSNTYKAFTKIFTEDIFTEGKVSKIFMSGTPAKSRVFQLYSVLHQISPLDFPTKNNFNEYYCGMSYDPSGFGGWVTDISTTKFEELFIKISPFTYRKKLEDLIKDLPEKTIQKVILEMTPKEYETYDKLEEGVVNEFTNKEITHPLAILNSLREYTSHLKITGVRELIDSILDSGEKFVVVDFYKNSLNELHKIYSKESALHTGDEKDYERADILKKFQDASSDLKLLLGSQSTISEGVTLTAANKIGVITVPWTPSDADQLIYRVLRIGQKNAVNAYFFVYKDTIDEYVFDLIEAKRAELSQVIDGEKYESEVDQNIINDLIAILKSKHKK